MTNARSVIFWWTKLILSHINFKLKRTPSPSPSQRIAVHWRFRVSGIANGKQILTQLRSISMRRYSNSTDSYRDNWEWDALPPYHTKVITGKQKFRQMELRWSPFIRRRTRNIKSVSWKMAWNAVATLVKAIVVIMHTRRVRVGTRHTKPSLIHI